MTNSACGAWDNGACEGTASCPPRCPRFVGRDGDPYLALELGARAPAGRSGLLAMYRDYPERYHSMGLPPRSSDEVRDWLDGLARRGTNVVAWTDGAVAGHACFAPADGDVPEMLVYVAPEYHGRGVGTELVKQVVARADARGHEALSLHVECDNETAVSIYRSLGFETVTRHAMELEMRLSLSDPVADRVQLAPAARA